MKEFSNDPFYGVLSEYPDLAVDYCLLKNEGEYRGEDSHREALLYAIKSLSEKFADEDGPLWEYDISRARSRETDVKTLLAVPDKPWKNEKTCGGAAYTLYDADTGGGEIPYWRAFLLPPCGEIYGAEDFERVNRALFPNGLNKLSALSWSCDWSDYFDDGREWWGTLCVTVYDRSLDRFAVITASATD